MRSLRRLLLLALLPSLFLSAAAAEPPKVFQQLNAGQKQTVIVYGTSLTEGGAWASATKQWFDQKYPGLVTFVNSGGSGQNSDWGVKNLQGKILAHKPDLVFIEFSYNDAHEKFKMTVEHGAENLAKIVKSIQEQNPNVTVVLQVMNVPYDAPNGNRSASSRPQLPAFNDNYRKYAQANNLPLLDHSIAWQKLKETDEAKYHQWTPDGTHPSKEGSLAVTFPTIKEWLEKSQAAAKAK